MKMNLIEMQNENFSKEENPSLVWSIRSCFFKPNVVVSGFSGIFPRAEKRSKKELK